MKLVALMPVRNEAWVLGLSARAALAWCDAICILLHSCTDNSFQIIADIQREYAPRRVSWTIEDNPQWDEMAHRQYLLNDARDMGATHIAIVDADEILTGNLLDTVRRRIEELPPGHILQLPGYNLRGSIDRYHANGVWANRWFSAAFQDDPRLGWSGDRFHAREPQGMALRPSRPVAQGEGGILHLWGASERRLRAKHALYKITERLRWPAKPVSEIDGQYNLAIYNSRTAAVGWNKAGPIALALDRPEPPEDWPGPFTFQTVPASWWEPYGDLLRYLDVDAVPWQEEESRRLVAEHGAAAFAGLDLFGVA
jgi:hypothetical protein